MHVHIMQSMFLCFLTFHFNMLFFVYSTENYYANIFLQVMFFNTSPVVFSLLQHLDFGNYSIIVASSLARWSCVQFPYVARFFLSLAWVFWSIQPKNSCRSGCKMAATFLGSNGSRDGIDYFTKSAQTGLIIWGCRVQGPFKSFFGIDSSTWIPQASSMYPTCLTGKLPLLTILTYWNSHQAYLNNQSSKYESLTTIIQSGVSGPFHLLVHYWYLQPHCIYLFISCAG